jgi:OmpA-OmpF porin, OOP family
MSRSRRLICLIALPITLALATSGCATKKYVRQQVAPVKQQMAANQKQTNDKIAAMWQKQEADMSQVNERISTTDQQVSAAAAAAQEAQGTASRAMDASASNSTAISNLSSGVGNALSFQLADRSDVFFGFDKASLTPQAKAKLDEIISKVQSMPRSAVELVGFTDPIGSASYNLALSRRRAEAVQRYLVSKKIEVRAIHLVGMGKEAPPPHLETELKTSNPHPTTAELHQLARRVQIQLYQPGELTEGNASRSDQ